MRIFAWGARRTLLLDGDKQRVCGAISWSVPLQVRHSLIGESLSHQEKYIQVLKSAELYFRNWNDRRRLIIVRGDDDTIRMTSDEATDNYRCELAVRNINLGKYFTWKCGEEKSCEPRRCPNFSFTGFLQSDGDAVPIE